MIKVTSMVGDRNATYRWPDVEDISWLNMSNVKKRLPKPTVSKYNRVSKYSRNDRVRYEFL